MWHKALGSRADAAGWIRHPGRSQPRSRINEQRHDGLSRMLADRRGRRVIFLSHCLLNENVRYLGGASRSGPVDELVDAVQSAGCGFCQMLCPEQLAWGGVLKRHLLLDRVVLADAVPGEGLFVAALRRELRRRRLDVPLFAHDPIGELQGVRMVSAELSRELVR
jgi:hypothetical protein